MASKVGSRGRGVLGSVFVAAALVAWVVACVGDDAAPGGGGDVNAEGGPGADGSMMSSGGDGAMPGSDSGGVDASCTTGACSPDGTSLVCGAANIACALGCAPAAGGTPAHCRQFDPSGSVDPSDLTQAGLKDFSGKSLKFFTDTGRITSTDEATEFRAPNAVATVEEVSADGIGFRLVPGKVGIFQFKNFTLDAASGFDFNGATGSVALAIVAAEEVKINGVLDLSCTTHFDNIYYPPAGSFPGSGTPPNNSTQLDGMGPGKGKAGNKSTGGVVISGAGGAGHGGTGGGGGTGIVNGQASVNGGTGGALYDDVPFDPPLGGSGGGAGAGISGGGGGAGGAGGGAVQIVAGVRITIGDGNGPDAGSIAQGINVGGCAGGDSFGGGGGGGAGGTILLEAPEVVGKPHAGVASNGGGGGGGVGIGSGAENGSISTTPAKGELENPCTATATEPHGAGGNGGAGGTPSGTDGTSPSGSCTQASFTKFGGGGGGAAGRVRINTASGNVTTDPSFVISPSIAPAFQKAKIATR